MKEYIKKNYLILLTILFCEIIFVCFGLPINPDDYWWHVKIGEWIFNNHSVQTTEIYIEDNERDVNNRVADIMNKLF